MSLGDLCSRMAFHSSLWAADMAGIWCQSSRMAASVTEKTR